ncbi:unnamed protein product [Parascedosporium putredinis]|uniref:GPAT/DHAPAT C-terminal domain-containing protein n=1 Tax=Parascedosporium putredinis TaxID=1442378 RepID=A0A9P1H074_9PEZI|nr:unnamed protein product [Parascedosporium putredinis]CAI7991536.1 unnamed protein product [Parascedosporium putredinis]
MASENDNSDNLPPDLQILGDEITLQPSGLVESRSRSDEKEHALMKNTARFRSEPLQFLREVSLYVSGTGWRAYDHIIGQPIYYPGFTEHISNLILSAPLLQSRIAELAEKRLRVEEEQGILDVQDPAYHVKRAQRRSELETGLQQVAEKLTDNMICKFESKPFIRGAYYLVTQLTLRAYHQGIHVSSEEVVRLRRVAEIAQRKRQSIIFLPCHRSHVDYVSSRSSATASASLCPPSSLFGILSFVLDSLLSGRVQDAIICPVSTQYDKVIETEGYVTELLGVPKRRRTWPTSSPAAPPSSPSASAASTCASTNPGACASPRRPPQAAALLGYRVLSDINDVSVVMPTALIGTVLLTLRGRGVGRQELARRVEWLTARVRAKGGRVAHFGNAPLSEIIERGLDVLGRDLVGVVDGLAEPTYYAVDRFQLSFYRNMTIHLFVSEALVSAAMYTRVKRGGGSAIQDISYAELRDQVLFLSSLFRGEFIFSGEGLAVNLKRRCSASRPTARAGRENYDFYCFLIWPFIEASWLAAVSLMGLSPVLGETEDVWVEVAKAQNSAQVLGKTLYHQGDLSYFEAVNKETIKNSFQRFEEEGILQVVPSKNPKVPPRLRLAPDLTDALGRQLQEEAKADKGNVPHRLSREEEETLAKKVKDSRGRKKLTTRANL